MPVVVEPDTVVYCPELNKYKWISPITEELIEADFREETYFYQDDKGNIAEVAPHSPENKFNESLICVIKLHCNWGMFGKRTEIMATLKSNYEFEYLRAKHKAKQELIAKVE